MPLDIYSTRSQLKALELLPQEHTFLYDMFCADMGTVENDKAIYDFRKGSRAMAPFVQPGTGGVVMERDGFQTREIGFCCIAPERIITMPDITNRAFGEDVLGAMTPEQRAKKMLAQDLMDMRKAIQRRREWMAMKVILDGKLNIFRYTNEGRELNTTLYADYGFTNVFTATTKWNQAGATIDADMHAIMDMVQEGLGTVEVMVMAPDVADAMVANDKYFKTFDGLNVKMGEINTKYRGQGVRFLGYNSDGVEMYSFAGKYIDDDGLLKPILPSGKIIAGSRGMLKAIHGPVTQVEEPGMNAAHKTYIKKEVPLRYGSIDGNAVKNRLTSCPTIVPFNVDGWAIANVL